MKGPSVGDSKSIAPAKRLAMHRAEMEGRLAALEGGDDWNGPAKHGAAIQWLGGEIWELEQQLKSQRQET